MIGGYVLLAILLIGLAINEHFKHKEIKEQKSKRTYGKRDHEFIIYNFFTLFLSATSIIVIICLAIFKSMHLG